ncbi:MAG TPA: DUF3298 and DUF4163 domain-containing protein [Ignavibacteriaceae bacterium]|nr:DUF3298 and DUF4163 domain-containing protein [Ignavibacteriaceae bacterium]
MKINLLSYILVIWLFTVYSCSGDKTPSMNDLMYELVTFQKQSEGCDGVRDDNCAKIKIEFPQITSLENKLVKEKINKSISDLFSQNILGGTKSDDFETVMNAFIEEYNSIITEFPDSYQSWFIERTGEVKLNKGNIFSIDYMEYSYTGGAHPNTFVTFKNFSLSNGEEIKLNEIIPADKQNELTEIAEAEFRKLKELTSEADLGQAGFWFENNKFYLNDNFLITDSSLVFYYNNYEITAYAFGPTELTIPFSRIKPLIGEKKLLRGLIE